MDSFILRYRNLLVLLALLLAQIIGLAVQVRRSDSGRNTLDPGDMSGVRLIRLWADAVVTPPEQLSHWAKLGTESLWQNYLDLRSIREQNRELQKTIDRLRLEQASLLEDAKQGERLQALVDFQQKYIYKTLAAQAIGSSGNDSSRVFYIDKGSAEGLDRDMAVLTADHRIGEQVNDSLWKHPNLVFGAIGIFVYVGGEVAIGSSIANYLALPNIGGFASAIADPATRYHAALGEAARYISVYWLGAMIGRFAGAALLQKVKPGKLLALCAVIAALLVSVSVLTSGHVAMWSILAVGLFNSVMFPCIFTMGIAELGPLTGDGSGILNMAIVGGAIIPWLVGKAGDIINRAYYPAMVQGETSWGQGIHYALIMATICYLYILFFAVSGSKPNSERYAKG